MNDVCAIAATTTTTTTTTAALYALHFCALLFRSLRPVGDGGREINTQAFGAPSASFDVSYLPCLFCIFFSPFSSPPGLFCLLAHYLSCACFAFHCRRRYTSVVVGPFLSVYLFLSRWRLTLTVGFASLLLRTPLRFCEIFLRSVLLLSVYLRASAVLSQAACFIGFLFARLFIFPFRSLVDCASPFSHLIAVALLFRLLHFLSPPSLSNTVAPYFSASLSPAGVRSFFVCFVLTSARFSFSLLSSR